jgi:D-psicose/D-tagatose/L-ribulose 3-epimerase
MILVKYGISSYVWISPFSNETFDQLIHAKEIGFDIYEIGVENPELIDNGLLKEEAHRVGISVNVCGSFGESRDISSDNETYRENGRAYIKNLIDMAEALNSPYVAGPMYAATGRTRLASLDERRKQREYALHNLRILGEYAEKKHVKLALEPINRFETDFMNTVEQGLEFIDELRLDNVGFLLDTFHMNIEEKSITNAIKLAGNKIFNFHACANDRGTPGEDHIDWAGIKAALKEVNYSGPIIIESFTTDIKEIAKAVSLWRPLAVSQDELARNGLYFLKTIFKGER